MNRARYRWVRGVLLLIVDGPKISRRLGLLFHLTPYLARTSDEGGDSRVGSMRTGRSNFGGGGRRRGSDGKKRNGNPIGTWLQNRRRAARTRDDGTLAVGTEAEAMQNLVRNRRHFSYPEAGFETPVEHSLLYAMIAHPERYPNRVIIDEINDEEFEAYLRVAGGDGTQTVSPAAAVSYAQLSALLSLSAEKNTSASSRHDGGGGEDGANPDVDAPSIGEVLCRRLLRTVTKYCDSNGLDRENEVREFLAPVERRCQQRNEKAALQQLLPAYGGYALSIVTGNPLPLLIGAAALTQPDKMAQENQNVVGFQGQGGRTADMERAGLLDEVDSD